MTETLTPYLVTATDARGRRGTFAREAASLDHLRAMLERDGYTQIEFVDDELSARLRRERPEEGKPKSDADYRFEAAQRHGDRPAAAWRWAAGRHLGRFVAAGLVAAYGIWAGQWLPVALAVAVVAGWAWLFRRGRARVHSYDDLLRASANGDWEAAARQIAALRADPALADNAQLQEDLAFRAAGLRAREGDLAGALADVEPLRAAPGAAGGLFEGRVAAIHYLAGDMPGFIAMMEAAYAAAGEAQLQRLDLALAHARVGDTARARALLDGVERRNLSTLHKPIAVAVEGMIARREGDEDGGALLLSDAVAGLSAFAANPAVWPLLGILVGHQAIALARSGDGDDAHAAMLGWEAVVDACLDAPTRDALHAALKAAAAAPPAVPADPKS